MRSCILAHLCKLCLGAPPLVCSPPLSALLASTPIDVLWIMTAGEDSNGSEVHTFERFGMLVALGAISASTTVAFRDQAMAALQSALDLSLEASAPLLGEIRAPLQRHDIKLKMSPPLLSLLHKDPVLYCGA